MLAFTRFVVRDIYRNKGRTLPSIIGIVLAVALIAGENIALDTIAKDVLAGELSDLKYDFYGISAESLTASDFSNISEELEGMKGVKDVVPISYASASLEVNNDYPIYPPKYGYYSQEFELMVPENGTVWLNTTLEPIPFESYKLYGYVYDQHTGEPVEGAYVSVKEGIVEDTGYQNHTYTDENGYYEMHLPEADYEISAETNWYSWPEWGRITTKGRTEISSSIPEKRFDIYIPTLSATIQGYINDSVTGEPYEGNFFIVIWNSSSYLNFSIDFRNSDYIYDGYYLFSSILGNISLWGDEGWNYVYVPNIEIGHNFTVWLNLTMETFYFNENVTLEGVVHDKSTGQPVVNASVDVNGLELNYLYRNTTKTDALGQFLMNIIPGNVSVDIGHPDDEFYFQEVQVYNPPGNYSIMNLELINKSTRVTGYIHTSDGHGDRLGTIRLEEKETGFSTSGDILWDGNYLVSVIPGNYTVRLDAAPSTQPTGFPSPHFDIRGIPYSDENIEFFEELFPFELTNGSLDLSPGNIVISEDIASQYQLTIDDQINMSTSDDLWDDVLETYYIDRKVVSFTLAGIIAPSEDNARSNNIILLNKVDFDNLVKTLEFEEEVPIIPGIYTIVNEFYILIERDSVIDPIIKDLTSHALDGLLTKINTWTFSEYGFLFENHLEDELEDYYNWLETYRLEMLAYSLPVIAVGFYLGLIGIDLAMGQKRRVLGILRSRGANQKQIFGSLILEAIILGIIAGGIGLLFGVLVSRLFLGIIPGTRNVAVDLDLTSLNITWISVFITMLIATLLMVGASIKPAKRVSRETIVESTRRHSESPEEKQYRPGLDIFLVSFAVFAFIVVSEINIRYLDREELGLAFTILVSTIYFISIIWLPFSPLVLMFSLTRLLTRGTDRVYRFFSRIVKSFSGDLWNVIHKNIMRNPKRVSMVSILVSLALGFGIFLTTMIGTTLHGYELETKVEIGSDLNVESQDANLSFEHDLESIDGVEGAVPVTLLNGDFLAGDDFLQAKIVLFNATEYIRHVEVDDFFFIEGSSKKALSALEKGNSVIIGENIAQQYSLDTGSMIRLDFASSEQSATPGGGVQLKNNDLRVAGIVRALPGLEIELYDYGEYGSQIYMGFTSFNMTTLKDYVGWRFLVDVEDGVDSEIVEEAIEDELGPHVSEIKNMEKALDKVRNDMPSNSILYLMLVNIGFLILIITVGLGLILYITISERKNEFAIIMARGAEAKQITLLIMGEALSITMIGVLVGTFSGLFSAYTFNKIMATNTLFGMSSDTISGRPLVVPWYGILVILLGTCALIITSIIAAYKARRIKLHQTLRVRGG